MCATGVPGNEVRRVLGLQEGKDRDARDRNQLIRQGKRQKREEWERGLRPTRFLDSVLQQLATSAK